MTITPSQRNNKLLLVFPDNISTGHSSKEVIILKYREVIILKYREEDCVYFHIDIDIFLNKVTGEKIQLRQAFCCGRPYFHYSFFILGLIDYIKLKVVFDTQEYVSPSPLFKNHNNSFQNGVITIL